MAPATRGIQTSVPMGYGVHPKGYRRPFGGTLVPSIRRPIVTQQCDTSEPRAYKKGQVKKCPKHTRHVQAPRKPQEGLGRKTSQNPRNSNKMPKNQKSVNYSPWLWSPVEPGHQCLWGAPQGRARQFKGTLVVLWKGNAMIFGGLSVPSEGSAKRANGRKEQERKECLRHREYPQAPHDPYDCLGRKKLLGPRKSKNSTEIGNGVDYSPRLLDTRGSGTGPLGVHPKAV